MEKYPLSLRITHWLMAIIIVGLLIIGPIMGDMPRTDPLRDTLFSLHKSFVVLVLLLFCVRVFLRLRLGVPALPGVISVIEQKLAHFGHYAFYGFMFIMPVSGILMTNLFGFPVHFFGVALPGIIGADKAVAHIVANFHSVAGFTLMGVVALHVAGVIKHRVKEGVNLLDRML